MNAERAYIKALNRFEGYRAFLGDESTDRMLDKLHDTFCPCDDCGGIVMAGQIKKDADGLYVCADCLGHTGED